MTTATLKIVMSRAWADARRGQTIYGGTVRQYFAEALRLAWIDAKANPVLAVAEQMIAEIRARKAKQVYAPPYSVRTRGNRAVTRWYSAA